MYKNRLYICGNKNGNKPTKTTNHEKGILHYQAN